MTPQRIFRTLAAIAVLPLAITCCSKGNNIDETDDTPGKEETYNAFSYTTTADKSQLFQKKGLVFDKKTSVPSSVSATSLALDLSTTYQTVDGFGAAMTWATCYNLQKMTQENRTSFMKEIFGKDGLGVSLVRVSIGASDFNTEEYTWCDTKGIENFEMHKSDKDVVVPVLKEMYRINPDVKIIASPWSCPRWMKRRSVNDQSDYYSWTSGSLKPEYYHDYASYFVEWIQAMEKEGFDIYAVTVQNEPLNHGNSMSMYMTWAEQRDFIKTALGPAFKAAGIKTKILVFDHNYNYDNVSDQKNYPLKIYADTEASQYVAGSAWHNYGGSVTELDNIVRNAPEKEIYFTEASIGTWNYNFASCLIEDFNSIFMQTLSRGCKGITLWNMVLDDQKGPYSPASGSCKTCYGALTMLSSTATITDRTSHYYNIAHASKVIKPGAVRIGLSGTMGEGLNCQAYRNTDGSYGVVILNQSTNPKVVTLKDGKHSLENIVPAKAITSVVWKD